MQVADRMIGETFSSRATMAVVVPGGDYSEEQLLIRDLERFDAVDSAESIAQSLVPELNALSIRYEESALVVAVKNGELTEIVLSCGGSIRVVSREVTADITMTLRYEDGKSVPRIPLKVVQTLLP